MSKSDFDKREAGHNNPTNKNEKCKKLGEDFKRTSRRDYKEYHKDREIFLYPESRGEFFKDEIEDYEKRKKTIPKEKSETELHLRDTLKNKQSDKLLMEINNYRPKFSPPERGGYTGAKTNGNN